MNKYFYNNLKNQIMKKKIVFPFIMILFFNIVSFSSKESKPAKDEKMYAMSTVGKVESSDKKASESTPSNPVEKINIEQRKLIKTGNIVFETGEIEKTKLKIANAANNSKAYISNEQSYSDFDKINNILVIRVPSQNFDKLLSEICAGVEKTDSKNIDVNDVTEEYLDIQARLKTKKELEQRYLDLLNKANKVSEILDIEREAGNLRADIESIEGRLKYLADRVDYSTLNVTYYKKIDHRTEFSQKFINGFYNGIKAVIWLFVGLVNIWPFIVIVILTLFIIRWFRRKKKNSK